MLVCVMGVYVFVRGEGVYLCLRGVRVCTCVCEG